MFSQLAIGSCLWVPKTEVSKSVRKELTIKNRFDGEKKIKTYQIAGKFCGLPRYWLPPYAWRSSTSRLQDVRVTTPEIDIQSHENYWEGQQEIVEKLRMKLAFGRTGVLVQVPTGGGKTFLAIKAIEMLKQRTLVVVPKSDLVEQWIEELLKQSNVPRQRLGWADGPKMIWRGRDIVVGLVHSLALIDDAKFIDHFGCVIFDEADRSVPPETFGPVAAKYPAKYRLGFSANLTREDGLHKILDLHVGESRIIGEKAQKLHAKVLVIDIPGEYDLPMHLDPMIRRGILLKKRSKDMRFNKEIASATMFLLKSEYRVIVMAEFVRHLHTIRECLVERGLTNEDMGYYSRQAINRIEMVKKNGRFIEKPVKRIVTKQEREITTKKRVILATFGMLNFGTDLPEFSGVIPASPRRDGLQFTGRVERYKAEKKQPVVIDVVMRANEDEEKWLNARLKTYRKAGNAIKFLRLHG